MFSKAIVRIPGKSLIDGLSLSGLGKPDYNKALQQHHHYINALVNCGLDVSVLDADETHADSTFVEDTALLTPACAILTNPGAKSRQGEITSMAPVVQKHYSHVEQILSPATLEAGDVMMVGNHFYIGVSARTNHHGAQQLITYLHQYGYTGSCVNLKTILHLKTAVAYLENNTILVGGELMEKSEFKQFNQIIVPDDEAYAANSIWINDTVLVPDGYPKTRGLIEDAGFSCLAVDVSEFRKVDGGLSCLSLRF